MIVENFIGHQPPENLDVLGLELNGITCRYSLLHSTCCEILKVTNCFRPKLLPATSHRLHLIQILIYVSYSFSCVVQFPASNDAKKGLQITCIQDTAEGVASVIALKCCDKSMVEQVQE